VAFLSESSHTESFEESRSSADSWLALGTVHGEQRWRLPEDVNLEFLEAQIKTAMRGGEALAVEDLDDASTRRQTLILNGRALPFVVLMATASDETA
jgi:hypothetical protein